MQRVVLVGTGRIAKAFLSMMNESDKSEWAVVGALARAAGPRPGLDFDIVDNLADLAAMQPDITIDLAGPGALRRWRGELLALANLWTVGGAALADRSIREEIEAVGRKTGHYLRLLSGAIGGLDALSAMAVHPDTRLWLEASCAGHYATPTYQGNAEGAVAQFSGVNVLAAAAIAARGLEETLVSYMPLPANDTRRFVVFAEGPMGRYKTICEPTPNSEGTTEIVAASVIAALRNEARVIRTA